jgi:hypothetical protein
MMTELKLPFKLHKKHKSYTKGSWKRQEMIFDDFEFEYWYNKYIYATHCSLEKCKKPFKSSRDRDLDHNHDTGVIRDIICRSCNLRRKDNKLKETNTSGYKGIYKNKCNRYTQGFIWSFEAIVDGKQKTIKKSVNYDKLVEFAEDWKKENNYNT